VWRKVITHISDITAWIVISTLKLKLLAVNRNANLKSKLSYILVYCTTAY